MCTDGLNAQATQYCQVPDYGECLEQCGAEYGETVNNIQWWKDLCYSGCFQLPFFLESYCNDQCDTWAEDDFELADIEYWECTFQCEGDYCTGFD